MTQVVRLITLLGLCLLTGFLGSMATRSSVNTWYAELSKPSWTPPGWVFAPVWTALYVVMAVAAWLVWRRAPAAGVRPALTLFFGQLLLNGLWSWLFFGLRSPGAALLEIALLNVSILATAVAFSRVHRLAGWLLAPYLVWVTFAAALNLDLWWRNS